MSLKNEAHLPLPTTCRAQHWWTSVVCAAAQHTSIKMFRHHDLFRSLDHMPPILGCRHEWTRFSLQFVSFLYFARHLYHFSHRTLAKRVPPCESTTTQSCFYPDATPPSLSVPLCALTSSQSSDANDLSCSPQPLSRRYAQPSQHEA